MTGYSKGPSHPATKPLPLRLQSLVAQRRLCGGDRCRPGCRRCARGVAFVRKEGRS